MVELGPSRQAELPVADLLAGTLADPDLQVRYAIPGRGWVDEQGRPVEPPPADGASAERVTRVPAPGGGEVALIGGPTAESGSALSRAAAVAAACFRRRWGGRPVGVLVREIAAGMPVPVRIDVDGPVEDLPPGLRALIYFFCSECLANMAKHAGASAATVRMGVTAGRLTVSASDNGRGGVSLAGSRGLRGLADRIEVAGGTLAVVSPPGGPTRISAEVPLPR